MSSTCFSGAMLIYTSWRTGRILKFLIKIHLSFQHWDHWMLCHCVGCKWNKRVFFNTCWKWKLSLVMMFWLWGIFQWQLLQREAKRSGLTLNTGLFLSTSAIQKSNDCYSMFYSRLRETHIKERCSPHVFLLRYLIWKSA